MGGVGGGRGRLVGHFPLEPLKQEEDDEDRVVEGGVRLEPLEW